MKPVKGYKAEDGRIFESAAECTLYESNLWKTKHATGLAALLLESAPYSDDDRNSSFVRGSDESLLGSVILDNLDNIRLFIATLDKRVLREIKFKPASNKPKNPIIQPMRRAEDDIGLSEKTKKKVKSGDVVANLKKVAAVTKNSLLTPVTGSIRPKKVKPEAKKAKPAKKTAKKTAKPKAKK